MFLKLLFETSVAHDLPYALEKIVIAEVNRHKLLLQGNQHSLQGMSLLEVINVFCGKNLTLLAVESIYSIQNSTINRIFEMKSEVRLFAI